MAKLFGRGIPAYLWIAVLYVIVATVIATPQLFSDGDTQEAVKTVEELMSAPLFAIPLLSGIDLPFSFTTVFIILGLFSTWVEVMRATTARASGNDLMSLIVTIVALVLFVGVPWFSTTAFMIVPLVGIGDLLLDRYVGQAVARRDFGPMYPHDPH